MCAKKVYMSFYLIIELKNNTNYQASTFIIQNSNNYGLVLKMNSKFKYS